MNNEEMKRSLRELCRIESVAGIDVSDDAPYGAGCAQADIESGKLTMNVGTIGVTDVNLVMEIDVRAPVTFEADAVTEPLRRAAAEYGIEVELTQDTPPVYMDKNGDVRPVDTRKHTPKKASKHECLRCDGLVYTEYACAAAPRPRTCSVFFGALQF